MWRFLKFIIIYSLVVYALLKLNEWLPAAGDAISNTFSNIVTSISGGSETVDEETALEMEQ